MLYKEFEKKSNIHGTRSENQHINGLFYSEVGMEKGMRMYAEAGFGAIDYGMFILLDGEVFTKYSASEFKGILTFAAALTGDRGLSMSCSLSP